MAITLLLLVIVGPMKILATANHSSSFANEQVTAWFLAQEGLELAQRGRDQYLLRYFNNQNSEPQPWNSFVTGTYAPCFTAQGCGLEIQDSGGTQIISCSSSPTACQLYLDTSSDRASYQYSSGGNIISPYKRVIKMKQTGSSREIAATSTVMWRSGSLIADQKVETSTSIFNIYDTP